MTEHYPLMIPGATSRDEILDVYAPYDGSLIATVDSADELAVEHAITTATAKFQDRENWLSTEERLEILNKTLSIMLDQADNFAIQIAKEGGKPLSDSREEVKQSLEAIKLCIDILRTESGREIPMNLDPISRDHLAFTHKEPIGIVVAFSAFNHPLGSIVNQVVPAIATGCPVIIKPSEDTPLSCFKFVDILRRAGLPDEWCQSLVVSNFDVAIQLVTDERVSFFSFTGSAKTGWMLRSRLAPGTRCVLEHGGAAPVIVTNNANIEDAISILAQGGFYHAGQSSVSVQRIFAHKNIARQLAEGIASMAENYVVGDPVSIETNIGPLIRNKEIERIDQWINEAIESGAELICGGYRVSDSCYACTVIYNPSNKDKISQFEIFGPVLCVYLYDDLKQAIKLANDIPYAFHAAVFSQDVDEVLHVYKHLNASAIMINDHTDFRVNWMPFAGLKQSGLGVGGIPQTMNKMQIEKMIVYRSKKLILN